MKRKVGRPKTEPKTRISIPNSRLEFIRIMINLSKETFFKIKKQLVEILKND